MYSCRLVALPLATRHCQIVFGTSEASFLRLGKIFIPRFNALTTCLSHQDQHAGNRDDRPDRRPEHAIGCCTAIALEFN